MHVCMHVCMYERMHLIVDSCWPAQVGLPECWVVLGEWGPFSREHAPKEFGDLEPLWSVQALRMEEYTHHTSTSTCNQHSGIVQYSATWFERPLSRETTCFKRLFFKHRLMFQCVSWPVIRDHLSWETTYFRTMRWSLKPGNTVLNSREGSSDERNLHEFGKEVGLGD